MLEWVAESIGAQKNFKASRFMIQDRFLKPLLTSENKKRRSPKTGVDNRLDCHFISSLYR